MPKKPSKTQERLEAIMIHKGTKNLADTWDEDRELDPKKAEELQK